eukprot:11405951-Prorocentrum_lima.AAC.1
MGWLKAKIAQLLAYLVVQRFPSGRGVPKHTEALSRGGEGLMCLTTVKKQKYPMRINRCSVLRPD